MGSADFYLNIYIDESLSLCVNEKLNRMMNIMYSII